MGAYVKKVLLNALFIFDRSGNIVMTPIWRLQNGQGPSWKYAQAQIRQPDNYQVVMEGVWGNNRVNGFIAVDDVTFFPGKCDSGWQFILETLVTFFILETFFQQVFRTTPVC